MAVIFLAAARPKGAWAPDPAKFIDNIFNNT
jgi:hypothetical protein